MALLLRPLQCTSSDIILLHSNQVNEKTQLLCMWLSIACKKAPCHSIALWQDLIPNLFLVSWLGLTFIPHSWPDYYYITVLQPFVTQFTAHL